MKHLEKEWARAILKDVENNVKKSFKQDCFCEADLDEMAMILSDMKMKWCEK